MAGNAKLIRSNQLLAKDNSTVIQPENIGSSKAFDDPEKTG
tara:strand:+ start:96404 stop:96526 length:123 start_codon:yes stop_codon:yes gene_type:complete